MFRTLSRPDFRLPAHIAMIVMAVGQALFQHSRIDRTIPLICQRLLKMAREFQALFDQWGNGHLPAARKRPHQSAQPKPASTQPKPPQERGFAWLVNILPEASIYRARLQVLFAEPNMAAFLAEVPQARRILRPLCQLLGVRPTRQIPQPQRPNSSAEPPETAHSETAHSDTAHSDNAPLEIAPKERPTAPMALDPVQSVDAKTGATQPEILTAAA